MGILIQTHAHTGAGTHTHTRTSQTHRHIRTHSHIHTRSHAHTLTHTSERKQKLTLVYKKKYRHSFHIFIQAKGVTVRNVHAVI